MTNQNEPLIEGRGLRKRYGAREVVAGVDVRVAPGEVLAVIGPNGAGKTTTLELLLGLRSPDGGVVRWAPGVRAGVQLQTPPVIAGVSTLESLRVVAAFHGVRLSAAEALALLRRCGLEAVAGAEALTLSGGQQKRLSIAMALVHRPDLVILDEPTAALDPRAQAEIRALVAALAREGVAVVMSSHDLGEVGELAHRVMLIEGGRVLAQGAPAELLAAHGVPDLHSLYLQLTRP